MNDKLPNNPPDPMTTPVVLTITPGATPARDLPYGLLDDVCTVLEAYGLRVKAPQLRGHGITEVMLALGRVVEVMPFDLGGRAGVERPDRPRFRRGGVVELPDEPIHDSNADGFWGAGNDVTPVTDGHISNDDDKPSDLGGI